MEISVDSSEIKDEVNSILEKNFNNDEKSFREALKQNGLSMGSLKEGITKDKIVQKVREHITDERVKITDKEKKEYYDKNKSEFSKSEQVKASHILVKEQKLADDIYNQLQKGGNFEALAKKHSTDTGSKEKNGDLGFFPKGQMVKEFENTAWTLKEGEISKPVKSQFGFHIIKKTGFTPAKTETYEQAKAKITKNMKEKKSSDVIDIFTKEERNKSKIVYYINKPVEAPANVTVSAAPSSQASVSAEKPASPATKASASPVASSPAPSVSPVPSK